MKVPVLFLIFDRKDVSIEAFKPIRKYQPSQIFIAADGSRLHKEGERERCEETRQAILEMIDWECEVKTLFREKNLGCAIAVSSAIDWFFENVEYGIIVEDDVVVAQSFFKFCEELLPKYRTEDKIAMITAQCLAPSHKYVSNQYTFSNKTSIWGWATWRRAWAMMDMSMSKWPNVSIFDLFKSFGLFGGVMFRYYWGDAYYKITNNIPFNSWATRWAFTMMVLNKLSVVPMTNLSKNIGCSGVGGAHYSKNDTDPYENLKITEMAFPLKSPTEIILDKTMQKYERSDFMRIRMLGLKKKIKNLFTPKS